MLVFARIEEVHSLVGILVAHLEADEHIPIAMPDPALTQTPPQPPA